MNYIYKIGIIGCGNMASAILNGIIKQKLLTPEMIAVSDISDDNKQNFKNKYSVNIIDSNIAIANNCEYVLFAVKPQSFINIANEIDNINCAISIMAGITIDKICKNIPNLTKICRIMPNTPCMIGKGMSALSFRNYDEQNIAFVTSIFDSLGSTIVLDESQLDAVTAISGSGPAYVYYFIKSMIDAGTQIGLSYEQSKLLTTQTFIGACEMVNQIKPNDSIDELINKVCSKGGTTIEAINSMQSDGVDHKIAEAVFKCYNRSIEMSKIL